LCVYLELEAKLFLKVVPHIRHGLLRILLCDFYIDLETPSLCIDGRLYCL
jgi:hypothetical protein